MLRVRTSPQRSSASRASVSRLQIAAAERGIAFSDVHSGKSLRRPPVRAGSFRVSLSGLSWTLDARLGSK